jgi:hypothetical protein
MSTPHIGTLIWTVAIILLALVLYHKLLAGRA